MNQLPRGCPFTGGEIVVTRFYCPETDVTIEGRFQVPVAPFAQLSPEQLDFVETFVRCEGKLSRMEGELGISYPTVRNRLHDVIRALGYEPGKEEPANLPENERKQILADLDSGSITFDEAMTLLQGESE
ncbi:MAG: DUF2089 domain-containing protein [Caldilineaceae bacterium]|nr:DUF2089 domain-containing protein [Caldilineaceae bacterium]